MLERDKDGDDIISTYLLFICHYAGGHDLDCQPKKVLYNNVLRKMLKVIQVLLHN